MSRVGRVRAGDVACLGGLVATLVWVSSTTLFVPGLIGTHPVLLEAINGGATSMVAAGAFARIGRTLLVWALLAPVLAWVPLDPFAWWAGRRYGRASVAALLRRRPGTTRMLAATEDMVRRYDWLAVPLAPWLPVPTTLVYAAAGWSGMPLWQFVALDTVGTVVRTAAMVAIGYAAGDHAVVLARSVSHNATLATVAMVAAIALWVAWRRLRARRSVPG